VEPASAASLAGLIKANAAGKIPEGSVVTATLTGHGLKDPDMALKQAPTFLPVEPTLDCVLRSLAL
ncbi:MAG: threonine synthase, partial [Candidatus Methylacidiphilales bacterium]